MDIADTTTCRRLRLLADGAATIRTGVSTGTTGAHTAATIRTAAGTDTDTGGERC